MFRTFPTPPLAHEPLNRARNLRSNSPWFRFVPKSGSFLPFGVLTRVREKRRDRFGVDPFLHHHRGYSVSLLPTERIHNSRERERERRGQVCERVLRVFEHASARLRRALELRFGIPLIFESEWVETVSGFGRSIECSGKPQDTCSSRWKNPSIVQIGPFPLNCDQVGFGDLILAHARIARASRKHRIFFPRTLGALVPRRARPAR